MIRIEKIRIQRFRGILDLTLDLKKQNYAICGPNGTGKSGVVDAIEFALSGDISRLSGKGSGGVSVKNHAPHVDYRNSPNDAVIRLEGVISATGTKFGVIRSVGAAQSPTIEPNTPEVVDTLKEFGRHKNVTLSRRELIQYVLSTPGDRAAEVQALLQLNSLRELRKSLQKIANASARDSKLAKAACLSAGNALATALGVPKLTTETLLVAINERRKILELPDILVLEANTSIKDGLSVAAEKERRTISRTVALADIKKLNSEIATCFGKPAVEEASKLIERLEPLAASKEFERSVDRQDLLTRSLDLIDDGLCPVCETVWQEQELIDLIRGRLKDLESFSLEKKAITRELDSIVTALGALEASVRTVAACGDKLDPKIDLKGLTEFAESLKTDAVTLTNFKSLADVISSLERRRVLPTGFESLIKQVSKAVSLLPDTGKRDAARDYLVAVEERLNAFREAKRIESKAVQDAELAQTVFEIFEKAYGVGLNKIYADIQSEFSELYSQINSDDEAAFEATLAAEKAGLGLDVDFYGRGKFPPGAYHSEGHQDGMGLCLYLALMQHLYGENFQFCVLDDVLMSVDSGHRRAVCKLLSEKFPTIQFIFTTHDEVWLKNMQTTGLIQSNDYVLFRNWDVESGPAEWIADDVWQEIDDDIAKNDIRSAAARLRHYLEFIAGQLSHNFRASVVYRGDNRHTLGDLMPQAMSRFTKLLKDAKAAAQSWENETEKIRLGEIAEEFKASITASSLEQWALNAKVHYNEWANLSKEDFQPVVAAFRDLLAKLECTNCHGLLYIIPESGPKESIRCSCGKTNINLKKK